MGVDMVPMLQRQLELQRYMKEQGRALDPTDPTLEQDQRIQFVKDMYIAIVQELDEALNEVGWKPWGTARHVNGMAFLREMVDAWHFFMNLMLAVAPFIDEVNNEAELAALFGELYFEKNRENWRRAGVEYHGFHEKCKYCGREVGPVHTNYSGYVFCDEEHRSLYADKEWREQNGRVRG